VLSAVEGLRDGVTDALALVPRVGSAVGRMEQVLDRVSALLTRVEGVVDRADEAISAIAVTQTTADEAIAAVALTQARADEAIVAVALTQAGATEAITAVARTTARAGETLELAEGLVGRMEPLFGDYEEPLARLAPSVRRLAETLEPHEVEALVTLIDRLPRLVTHLDEDILPVLESLGNVGPDLHNLVDTVQDLRHIVKGFPGSRLFRRRGAEEIAEDEAEDEAQEEAQEESREVPPT
jgi:hypothetical protein